jgi:hypothetical protein
MWCIVTLLHAGNRRDVDERVWLCMVVLSQWRVEGRPNRGRHVKGLEVGG